MPKMMNVCNFCLKSGILCPKCQAKLNKGEISKIDLEIGRLLNSLESSYPPLQEVNFHKAVETDSILALIVGKGDVARLLSYGGKILKTVGEKTGKTVRILEYGVDERKFLEDLFAPMSIITINTIWLPDGSQETRVILRRRGRKPSMNVEALKQLAQKVRGVTLRVEFAD
jgi:transcription antitermination factor NusA-like protein